MGWGFSSGSFSPSTPSDFNQLFSITLLLLLNCSWEEKRRKKRSFVYISTNGIYHLWKGIFAVLIMNVYFIHTSSKLSSYAIRSGGIYCFMHSDVWKPSGNVFPTFLYGNISIGRVLICFEISTLVVFRSWSWNPLRCILVQFLVSSSFSQ